MDTQSRRDGAHAEKCFACGRRLPKSRFKVWTLDGQNVFVGPDCYAHVSTAHKAGYQPPLGGPKLYTRVVYMWLTRTGANHA